MAPKATTDTCCLTLPLVLEKWQADRLEKRLEIARQLYNTLLNFELKKLRQLEQTTDYQAIQRQIDQIIQDNPDKSPSPVLKQLFQQRDGLRKKAGFTEDGFKTDMKKFQANIAEASDKAAAVADAYKKVDQACARGLLHPNTAARRKSAIAKAAAK